MITRYRVNAPIDIFYGELGLPQDYRQQLIEETYRLKNREGRENEELFKRIFDEKDKSVIASSFGVWNESRIYDLLLKNILMFIENTSPPGETYKIINTWVGIYNKDQIATKHAHEPAYKSFCYYISADEPYTPMVFNDIGIEIDAVTDRLITFPSHVNHSVPPCRSNERIIIAGNIGVIFNYE